MPLDKHIILADDDTDDVELFQLATQKCSGKIRLSTADDGLKLMELLEKEALPDVIVLDLNMPRMSGYDCLKIVRLNKRYKNTPVVIFSTSSLQMDIDYCLANGANYYVVKPESFEGLIKFVGDLCKGLLSNHFSKWA